MKLEVLEMDLRCRRGSPQSCFDDKTYEFSWRLKLLEWIWGALEVHLKALLNTKRMISDDVWGSWDGFEVPLRFTSKLFWLQNVWILMPFEVLELDLKCRWGSPQSSFDYKTNAFWWYLRFLTWIWGSVEVVLWMDFHWFEILEMGLRFRWGCMLNAFPLVWCSWDGFEVPLR